MTEPVSFTSETSKFGLPFLFAGQAQKEFFFNEAQVIIDAVINLAIVDTINTPPSTASEGDCWIVASNPIGEWTGHTDKIALRLSNGWKYITPREGMAVYSQAEGRNIRFANGWLGAETPIDPAGGSVIDIEARYAITSLIQTLKTAGILPQ